MKESERIRELLGLDFVKKAEYGSKLHLHKDGFIVTITANRGSPAAAPDIPSHPFLNIEVKKNCRERFCIKEECCTDGVRDNAEPSCTVDVPQGWRIVERCDACDKFKTDLDAAKTVSKEARWVTCPDGGSHVVAKSE